MEEVNSAMCRSAADPAVRNDGLRYCGHCCALGFARFSQGLVRVDSNWAQLELIQVYYNELVLCAAPILSFFGFFLKPYIWRSSRRVK